MDADHERWKALIAINREAIRRLRLLKRNERCPLGRLKLDCSINERRAIIRGFKQALADARAAHA